MLETDRLTNEETAERIRLAIFTCPKPKTEIAELLNVTPQAITGWETTGRISKTSLAGLAKITSLPFEYFISRKPPETVADEWGDILGYAQEAGLGNGADAQEYAETHKLKFRADSLRRKNLQASNLAVFTGKGDSMLPRIKTGDAVLFDQTDRAPTDKALFVVMWHGEYYVKQALVLDGTVYFQSTNPDADHQWKAPKRMDKPRDPIEVIGRVRWIGSWED